MKSPINMRYLLLILCFLMPCVAYAEAVPGTEAWEFNVSKAIAIELAESSVWNLAIPYLRELSPKTQDWHVLFLMAKVELQQGDLPKAQSFIERALEAYDTNPRILALAGNIAIDTGRTEDAAQYYEKTLLYQPNHVGVLTALARIRYSQQQWSEVIVLTERLLEHALPTSEMLVRLAAAYESTGVMAKAEKLLKQNLEVHPNRVLALMPLERFYRRQHQISKADEIARERKKLQKTTDGDSRHMRALLPSSR